MTYEVLPVTSGYRWVLTYNLIHPPDARQPSANALSQTLVPLHRVLRRWSEEGEYAEYDHMFYMLGDRHAEPSLSLSTLKRATRVQVRALEENAASLGYEIFLTLLEKKERPDRDYSPNEYYDDDVDEEPTSELAPGKTVFSMSNLVNLRGRRLISEYTFSGEHECVDKILQGHNAFDSVSFDEEGEEEEEEEDYYGGKQGRKVPLILPCSASLLVSTLLCPSQLSSPFTSTRLHLPWHGLTK